MASPSSEAGRHLGLHLQHAHAEPAPESAVREAQRWIEAVTGRCFGEKDLRRGLDNGILLCELLSSIKPGLVKKINRLPTPVAGLDNLVLFLRGCEELGLKGSQLFDPGDLQDTSTRPDNKGSESSRKLKNVLITIYWLGRAANGSATFNGPTLDLRQFEGLLAQMRKEAEDLDSPKRSIRDSGYIDCWESERSDSLSPPRHGRDDSFDSLDSIGSRSRQTPSPDVLVARGNSDGRGSDSESDAPHRKMPDVRKDDMLARRTSCSEPRTAVPFNQYLPNKSNQCGYVPTALRRKRADCEDGRKSWSNATSPIGGERPFSESDSSELALPSAVTTLDPHAVDPTPQDPPSKKPSSKVACPKNGRPTTTHLKESPPSDAQTKPLHHGEPPSSPHPSPKPQQASPEEEELEEEEDPAERSPVPPSTDGAVAHTAAPETGRGPPSGSQLPQCTTQPTDLATLRHLTSDPRWHSPSGSPARSCSAELYHTSLVTNAMTTSIIVTSPVSPARSPAMPRRVPSPRPDGGGMVSPSTSTGKDDMWARRTPTSPKHATPSPTHLLPEPTAANQSELTVRVEPEAEKSRKRPSCLDDDLPPAFSHRASVSDDPESVSMIDVRCEEDAMLSPHSQLRHGLMHGQYHRMKEEDDHWQDDLARWKNRRRSVSQDLIKKEEERKMMERLISGEDDSYQRKKSIKTYREIVEDKERRERELHEAYRQARTPEEAASVLQRYAQRFTISEAVLERLKLPKLLDRSVSADPSALCLDPDATAPPAGPLQYLRQRSLPATKFTSMVEARVGSYGPDQSPESSLTPAPANTGTPKVVPLLSPKPYSAAPRTAMSLTHADSAPRVNGETGDEARRGLEERGRERERERERELDCSPLEFFPSPSLATHSDPESAAGPTALPADARAPEHAERPAEVAHTPDSSPGGPGSHSPEQGPEQSREQGTEQGREQAGQEQPGQEQPPSQPTPLPTQELQSEGGAVPQTQGVSSSTKEEEPGAIGVADLPASTDATCSADSLPWPTGSGAHSPDEETPANGNSSAVSQNGVHTELAPAQEDKAMAEVSESGVASPERGLGALNSSNLEPSKTEPVSGPLGTELATSAQQPSLSSNPRLRWEFFAPPEGVQQEQGNVVAPAVLSLVRQGEHVSWDPEEERRRQERWQREQERMLQEKYRREQEKLKQEWERAQKEVEEEERRYHEEEKRILEETVAPLTPHSPAPPSPRHVVKAPPTGPQPPQDTIVRSLADWQRKQELLEKQTSGMAQNWRPDDRINVAESAMPQTSGPLAVSSERQPRVQRGERSQSRGPSPRSSQDGPKSSKQQEPEPWEKTASLDRSKTTQSAPPAGQRRRSSSIENVGPNSSKPSSCSSDTQPPSPNRSVSGKKLCSSCGHPLGKGAAMIIETLSLYFHIQCFKCGICKGQLGDTTTGTDVRIRNGLLNCHQCYLRSRSAGQPTTL